MGSGASAGAPPGGGTRGRMMRALFFCVPKKCGVNMYRVNTKDKKGRRNYVARGQNEGEVEKDGRVGGWMEEEKEGGEKAL